MAPASASPQPSSRRSGAAGCGGQGQETDQREGATQHEQPDEQHELYGPLGIERLLKDDGRALIIYARRECQGK